MKGFTIIESQQRGTREGRDGRLRDGLRTEWLLFEDGILLAEYPTRREAATARDVRRAARKEGK